MIQAGHRPQGGPAKPLDAFKVESQRLPMSAEGQDVSVWRREGGGQERPALTPAARDAFARWGAEAGTKVKGERSICRAQ